MNEIDVLAEYVDYRTADGCLDWNEFKTLKHRQEISKDFDAYIEKQNQPKKSSLEDLLLRFDKKLETLNLNLNELKEGVNELKEGVNEIKSEIKEIKKRN